MSPAINQLNIIVVLVFGQLLAEADVQQCGSQYSIFGMMLRGHTYKTLNASISFECNEACNNDFRCHSFHFVIQKNVCELNNRTKEARPDDFIPDGHRYYFRRHNGLVPLGSIPELPAEKCKEIKASEGGHANSGKYWFDSILAGEVVYAHCDMDTEDINECNASVPVCVANATCQNTEGSYVCSCEVGFAGKYCTDINECRGSIEVCDANANCQNNWGSYSCSCKAGYTGDGKSCSDVDECSAVVGACDDNSNCQNTEGSYDCACMTGFTGDGKMCTDINECNGDVICDVNANCQNTPGSHSCSCKQGFYGDGQSCALNKDTCQEVLQSNSAASDGAYPLTSSSFLVYCDMTSTGQAWTLIARFSNKDAKNWMVDTGHWWYDKNENSGDASDPSINADMMSPAFWVVSGNEFKITRSDDQQHTPLLQTTGNCLGGQTFRSKVTSYGDFRDGEVWATDQCLGSCTVQYDGQYQATDGFQQAACSGDMQDSDAIGFWCDWSSGDGAVLMIGGGGSSCSRADHGIGVTEANEASFVYSSSGESDFGNNGGASTSGYSLNLWIR